MDDAALRNSRILIVDDQVANIGLLENILRRLGYHNLQSTTQPQEVMELLHQVTPDLILLDLMMPVMDGFQVMEQLKSSIPKGTFLPIVVLTADCTATTKHKALSAGAIDFLTKPLDVSEVLIRIGNLLQARHYYLQTQQQNEYLEQKVLERTRELVARKEELEKALFELEQSQRQLIQQERFRAFGEMAGGVVHDFNNALMSIIGYSDLLIRDPELLNDRKTAIQFLKTMNTAGNDAAHVIDRLRDFYRPREESDVLQHLNVNDLIEQAVALTQPKWKDHALASGRTIRVLFELQKVPLIEGNGAELREVLVNLIFNAVDAMPNGGDITLRSFRENDQAIVEVHDTGLGMSDDVKQRCLEPFFTTKGDNGTGLGLSMVFGIIQRHLGRLEVTSEPGKGTAFKISLPAKTLGAQATQDAATKPVESLHVLVADDEPVARDVVAKFLLADGHSVVTAATGPEALEQLKSDSFDLLITDYGMPGMNGEQIVQNVKETCAREPLIILMTGFSEEVFKNGNMSAAAILRKPVTQAQLRTALFHVTEQERGEVVAAASSL
jgi:signal transduction histidine kinase